MCEDGMLCYQCSIFNKPRASLIAIDTDNWLVVCPVPRCKGTNYQALYSTKNRLNQPEVHATNSKTFREKTQPWILEIYDGQISARKREKPVRSYWYRTRTTLSATRALIWARAALSSNSLAPLTAHGGGYPTASYPKL
ncbi:hypothetical protein RRG08_012087 [Elysia crispata]|uniref:Uncharacterized protein n=1 Tax=Elysia crispata TaxID=231223 RepID=A0AAE0YTR9_9GAST|nr:hypothetical protein RRG08_012087 [Elysia crispata]